MSFITAAIPLDHLKNHYYSVILDCPFCFVFIIEDTYTTNAARGNRSVLLKQCFLVPNLPNAALKFSSSKMRLWPQL